MTVEAWIELAKQRISTLDAELIALACFAPRSTDRSWLVTHNVAKITPEMQQEADEMLGQRSEGEPLAYILGEREFFGRNFQVGPEVLIPRTDTEALIYLVKDLNLPKQPRFLEIGTGSGCIAITLALEYPQAYVLATDVSQDALSMAELNDILHEGRVDLVESDLLANIDPEMDGSFDVLVANLPYVDLNWEWLDQKSLRYEPQEALYAEEGGLALYHRLLRELQEKIAVHNLMHHAGQDATQLCHGEPWVKYLVLEADPCQHQDLVSMAGAYGWELDATEGFGLRFVAKSLGSAN